MFAYAEHPIIIANPCVIARFASYGDRFDRGSQIFREIDRLEKRLADDHFGFDRQIQVDRKSVISHFLILGRHRNSDVVVALAPIVGFADIKTVNALGYDEKTADGVLRISFSPQTTKEEIEEAAKILNEIGKDLQRRMK